MKERATALTLRHVDGPGAIRSDICEETEWVGHVHRDSEVGLVLGHAIGRSVRGGAAGPVRVCHWNNDSGAGEGWVQCIQPSPARPRHATPSRAMPSRAMPSCHVLLVCSNSQLSGFD